MRHPDTLSSVRVRFHVSGWRRYDAAADGWRDERIAAMTVHSSQGPLADPSVSMGRGVRELVALPADDLGECAHVARRLVPCSPPVGRSGSTVENVVFGLACVEPLDEAESQAFMPGRHERLR